MRRAQAAASGRSRARAVALARVAAVTTTAAAALAIAAGCASGPSGVVVADSTAAGDSTARAEPPGPNAWEAMTFEERHGLMTWTLLPNMARRFRLFERTALPELACITCHGVDAESHDYRMPATLPPLDPAHMPSADAADPEEARTVRFMTDVVTPFADRMMRAGGTITCFSCHPRAGEAVNGG